MIKGRCIRCGHITETDSDEERNIECATEDCGGTVRGKLDNVEELPVGNYDAIRTLRTCLQMVEKGEYNRVMVVVQNVPKDEIKGTEGAPDVFYSEMPRWEALWLARFLNSFIDHRFFGKFHNDDD